MIYIMNEGRSLNQPSREYYSTILEGYKSAGFDVSYELEGTDFKKKFGKSLHAFLMVKHVHIKRSLLQ
nr:hypothetical protein [Helcococcus sueciensis]